MEETKVCEFSECGKEYSRTVSASGKLQPRPTWERRRFCSPDCANRGRGESATQRLISEVEWLIGTDHPESIAVRVGYQKPRELIRSLRRNNRADLADRLSREWSRYMAPTIPEPEPSAWYA